MKLLYDWKAKFQSYYSSCVIDKRSQKEIIILNIQKFLLLTKKTVK